MADRVIDVKEHAHLMPGRLLDANGQEVRHCRRANLDTGEVEVFEAGGGGTFKVEGGLPYVKHDRRPAPLTFVSLRGE